MIVESNYLPTVRGGHGSRSLPLWESMYIDCLAPPVPRARKVLAEPSDLSRFSRFWLLQSKCPIFFLFTFKYSRECRLVLGRHGTRSTTLIPARSSCATLSGLFESSRTRLTPSSFSASAQNS